MRTTFDRSANAAYIYLTEIGTGEAAQQVFVDQAPSRGMIVLDVDKKGRLLGIEVLEATRVLPQELLDEAQRI